MKFIIVIILLIFILKLLNRLYLRRKATNAANNYRGKYIQNRRYALLAGQDILKYFHLIKRESAAILFLDSDNRCINTEVRFGSSRSVKFPTNEIIRNAKAFRSTKIVLMHNHPDDRPTPSDKDVMHAANLNDLLGDEIELVDDLVWCRNQVKSVLNTLRYKQMIKTY